MAFIFLLTVVFPEWLFQKRNVLSASFFFLNRDRDRDSY